MSSSAPRWTVDANVILRYLLADSPDLSGKARDIWQLVEQGRTIAVLDPVTLAEVVFVMSSVYGLANGAISDALTALVQPDVVVMPQKARYLLALRLFAGPVKHFGDACACAAALEESCGRLYSFDRDLSGVEGVERRETVADQPGI